MKLCISVLLLLFTGCGGESSKSGTSQVVPVQQSAQNNQPPTQKCQLDINEASEKEMLKMDGVGEVKAKAIINYRAAKRREATKKGNSKWNFNSWADVMAIDGIGESICEKNKSKICFNGRPSFGCKTSGP